MSALTRPTFDHEGQYEIWVDEHRYAGTRWRHGMLIRLEHRTIDDPFITTTIGVGGKRRGRWSMRERLEAAWHAFWGLEFTVRVTGTRAAHRVIFTGDYTPPPKQVVSSALSEPERAG